MILHASVYKVIIKYNKLISFPCCIYSIYKIDVLVQLQSRIQSIFYQRLCVI
jgi:hypothetical protein